MSNQKPAENILGFEPIGKLLLKYAIPSVISMIVMSLYNIVDQVFIGWGVGYLGNTATTVAFPLSTVGLALALLIGSGSAALISLELGRGNSDKVQKITGSAVTMLLLFGVVFSVLVLSFLRPVLLALGATEAIMPYAVDYVSVIMIGMPFTMMNTGLSHIIRADGSPRFSMFSTVLGALLNVVLDPIFIFAFDMGVKGAAVATVISQIISWVLSILYIFRFAKYARFEFRNMAVQPSLVGRAMALGSASFVNQSAITLLNIVLNNSLRIYGAASPYGSEIPLAAMGIVMKINSILISCIVGVTIGSQPIIGYNYGARNYARVRKTYFTVVRLTFVLAAIFNILFIATPETFISLFGDSSPEFVDFACLAMSTYLGCVFAAGIQIPSANFFQSIGKPLRAMSLTMTRSVIILIPAILILPRFFGIRGILYAGPVGDVVSTLVTSFFIIREMRRLGRLAADMESPAAESPQLPQKAPTPDELAPAEQESAHTAGSAAPSESRTS